MMFEIFGMGAQSPVGADHPPLHPLSFCAQSQNPLRIRGLQLCEYQGVMNHAPTSIPFIIILRISPKSSTSGFRQGVYRQIQTPQPVVRNIRYLSSFGLPICSVVRCCRSRSRGGRSRSGIPSPDGFLAGHTHISGSGFCYQPLGCRSPSAG